MFSGGDTSCGPSNPLQNFSKHADRQTTANQERFIPGQPALGDIRSTRAQGPVNANANAEFSTFAGVSNGPSTATPHLQQQQQQQVFNNVGASQHHVLSGGIESQNQWAGEFSRMSLGAPDIVVREALHHHQHQNYQPALAGIHFTSADVTQVYGSNGGYQMQQQQQQFVNSMYQTAPQVASMDEHKQVHHEEAMKKQFDQAFEAVESSLNETTVVEEVQQVAVENDTQLNEVQSDDLSEIARGIINNMGANEERSSTTAQKMKNSKFMDLMSKLSNRSVVIRDDQFVEERTGKKVEMIKEVPQELAALEESIQQDISHSGSTTSKLQDPFEALKEAGVSFDDPDRLDVNEFTPFTIGKRIIPEMTSTSAWEEKYDEDGPDLGDL